MYGEKIGTYTYDAWGNFTVTLASTNTSAENEIVNTYNPFRYRGYYYDVETGLYYLQSRYYNPAWGRFINADGYVSTGQGLLGNNMFAYCGNNPTMNVDFSGDFFKEFLDGVQSVIDEVKEVVDYCFTDLLFAIGDALIVDIGVGHGIAGAKEVDGISVEAVARMDMITVRKDAGNNTRFYVGKAKETYVSVEGMHSVFEKGTKEFYSLDDELLYSIPVEPHYDLTTSYSVKGYSPLIGITFEVGIDINYLVSRLTNGEVILWKG